ncbi:MAG: mannosyl-3-phosphoglycerate synthase [Chitinophagales bacterium]|nr:mannosyl-3-phosphoglycerate synthase [Chitinophagales bacterium]
MRIELPKYAERFGAVLLHDVQKVYELDGGYWPDEALSNPFHVIRHIEAEKLHQIEKDLAIIIPTKNERLRLLEGVLSGLPHDCLPIVLSNSDTEAIDRFRLECQTVENFCCYAKKKYLIMHQRSEALADLVKNGGYTKLLDEHGLVRNGKAEGMIAGVMLAQLMGKKYVGFVDADNYFPGSVFEYVRIFSAGLSQSSSSHAMVRIQWHSKPKIEGEGLFFAKWGRVSRISNLLLNRLISQYTGFETDVVKTGNAGEHAMSMELALQMDYSAGFSIETHHFVNLMERFGGVNVLPEDVPAMQQGVYLYQIESRNPHLHDAKEDGHVEEMIHQSLSVIYHSPLCTEVVKSEILGELRRLNILKKHELPKAPVKYGSLQFFDFDKTARIWDPVKYGNTQLV